MFPRPRLRRPAVERRVEDEDRELEGMSASPYSDCDDDAGVRAVRALRAGSNASPGFDENDGDHWETKPDEAGPAAGGAVGARTCANDREKLLLLLGWLRD